MFTGIVEERGALVGRTGGGLTVAGPVVTADAVAGDSIAVNGVCLTVVELTGGTFTADLMPETLARTALGALAPGDPVNLERAVTPATRLGGHLVQGHVDGVGTVRSYTGGQLRVGLPDGLSRYLVPKGSITVDGVSLTVVATGEDWFEVGLIPATVERTTLGMAHPGTPVNLEVDVIAKYVEKLLPGVSR